MISAGGVGKGLRAGLSPLLLTLTNLRLFLGSRKLFRGYFQRKKRGCNSVISSNFQFAQFAQFAQQTGGGNFGRAKI